MDFNKAEKEMLSESKKIDVTKNNKKLEEWRSIIPPSNELKHEYGLDDYQIKYMKDAEKLVLSGRARDVEDIELELGYGVIDKPMLQDTFF